MTWNPYTCQECGFIGFLVSMPLVCPICLQEKIAATDFARGSKMEHELRKRLPESLRPKRKKVSLRRIINQSEDRVPDMIEGLDGLIVYTDGSAQTGSRGRGGWAFAWRQDGIVYAHAGFSRKATNNQMEIQAVLEAVLFFPEDCKMTVVSDSQYVVNGVNGWMHKWKGNGWRRTKSRFGKGGTVKNLDQWQAMYDAVGRHQSVRLRWERGHRGEPMNELCDSLCGEAARQQKAIQISIPADQL